jgi:hypothetical protein
MVIGVDEGGRFIIKSTKSSKWLVGKEERHGYGLCLRCKLMFCNWLVISYSSKSYADWSVAVLTNHELTNQ